jgi:tRNA 2-thiouridine synthesizing protein C
MKKLLFISRQAPYGNATAREALDALLAASAYDQDLSILFMDDGVFQLVAAQNPKMIQQKNLGASLQALELYGIENIYIQWESLKKRGLTANDLAIEKVQIVDSGQIKQLMSQQDQILSF